MPVHATKFLILRRDGPEHSIKGRLKNFKRGLGGRLKIFWRTGDRDFFLRAGIRNFRIPMPALLFWVIGIPKKCHFCKIDSLFCYTVRIAARVLIHRDLNYL